MSTQALHARALLALALLGGGAAAEHSPWYLGLQQTLTQESNLYRIDDAVVLSGRPGHPHKSDLVSTTSLLGGLDQPIGRQRLFGSASFDVNRYRHNAHLDHEGHALELGLDWATVNRLSGRVSVGASRRLARYDILGGSGSSVDTALNLAQARRFDAAVRLGLVTRLSAEAILGHRAVSYTAPAYRYREYRHDTLAAGLRYKPREGLEFGVALRQTEGRYPHFRALPDGREEVDRFTRRDLELSTIWNPGGPSRVAARLAFGRTGYEQDTQRDFSGATGALVWHWQPGARLQLRTDLTRDIGQSADYVIFGVAQAGLVDYSRTITALRVRADYTLGAKVAVYLSAMQAHRVLEDTRSLAGSAPTFARGSDDTTTWLLGARWLPLRSTTLGCEVGQERRSAEGGLSTDVEAGIVSCYGRFVLP